MDFPELDTVEIDCCAEIYLDSISVQIHCAMCVSLDLGLKVGMALETVEIVRCKGIHFSPDFHPDAFIQNIGRQKTCQKQQHLGSIGLDFDFVGSLTCWVVVPLLLPLWRGWYPWSGWLNSMRENIEFKDG